MKQARVYLRSLDPREAIPGHEPNEWVEVGRTYGSDIEIELPPGGAFGYRVELPPAPIRHPEDDD